MKFEARVQALEASPVELAGVNLMVIAVDGKAHVVPADAFALLFAPVAPENGASAHVVSATIRKVPKPPLEIRKAPKTMDAEILDLLRRFGPMTTSEVGSHLFPGERIALKRSQPASAALGYLKKDGKVERRECPDSRIDKWFLV